MTTVTKVLFESKMAEAASTVQYVSTDVTTMIDKLTAFNTSASPVTMTVNLIGPDSTAAASNRVIVKNLAAGTGYTFPEVVGHTLAVGGAIATTATTAGVVAIRASGRQIT